ncbi:PepSY domain-containing protein [Pseudonocardia sp. TRM90224]|uniref:PepSY domain-containing protein n=1 Tax=Pseudonocardia sp. TRM90224 TaxID=2812678 RepID=UPI001E383375|nr:PepSY domain-containing protein [Pseudonocardia sp. TRM90224]
MMARRIIVVGAVAAAAALAIGGVALADGFDDSFEGSFNGGDDNRSTAVSAPRVPAALPAQPAPPAAPTITSEQATTAALQHLGGGQAREVELEREHGRLEWDVDVIKDGTRHDVRVDATSGQVTRQDVDDDGRDDDRYDD